MTIAQGLHGRGSTIATVCVVAIIALGRSVCALADTTADCAITPPIPPVPNSAKVIASGPGLDDTVEIQRALNELKAGDWLVFSPGTYHIREHLLVHTPSVTLYGQGATIHANNPTDGAILIQSDSVAVYGFKLEQSSSSRQSTPWSGGISVFDDRGGGRRQVHGVTIQNNTVNNSAGAGIFLYKAEHFTVANNTIFRSWADGIHMTAGTMHGRIIHNTVSQTGDDMIAVVSYAGSRKPSLAEERYSDWTSLVGGLDKDIYIYGNQLSDQYWGRGISVVGGSDVTIDSNTISKVPGGAGIYLARETAYMTFGDHNILVRNNKISQIQTSTASYDPANRNARPNGTGAIEAASELSSDERSNPTYRAALSITDVAIINNAVDSTRFAAIRLGAGETGSTLVRAPNGSSLSVTSAPGPVSGIVVQSNRLSNVNSNGVVAEYPGLEKGTIFCTNNVLNGTQMTTRCGPAASATSTPTNVVVGAALQCASDGSLSAETVPNPPTSVSVSH